MKKINKTKKMIGEPSVNLPENTIGNFSIKKCNNHPHWGNATQLLYKGESIMSDRMAEYIEHLPFFLENLYGTVMVSGLGIGFINEVLIELEDIDKVIIVEKYQDVIDLVWPHCKKDERFEVVHADADTWEPTMHFDYMWLDHWTSETHPDMKQEDWWKSIIEKYSPYCENIMVWKPSQLLREPHANPDNFNMIEVIEKFKDLL
tara:strand:- start:456 stop:1067 length:612 start_codon:yes stop_codon:yes gene_type:complete